MTGINGLVVEKAEKVYEFLQAAGCQNRGANKVFLYLLRQISP